MKKEIMFHDYISFLQHDGYLKGAPKAADKLGIWYDDKEILFGWEKNVGYKRYDFGVILSYNNTTIFTDNKKKDFDTDFELLTFKFGCNLRDFIKTRTYSKEIQKLCGGKRTVTDIDWEKLIAAAIPAQYNEAKLRLARKAKKKIPAPVIYTDEWCGGMEFIAFTKSTVYAWAGPFEFNKKVGACLKVKTRELQPYPILDVRTGFNYYDLPYNARPEGADMANTVWSYSPEQKATLFDSLTVRQKHLTALEYYSEHTQKSWLDEYLPFYIYICGNDDCSYSRYFATQEEVDIELDYLRKMQPLNFYKDIRDRNYHFTN